MKKTSTALIFKKFKAKSSKNIVNLIKITTDGLKSKLTIVDYISDPNKYEILNNGRIVCKEELKEAQRNFRNNYQKIKEFFE